MVDWFTELLWSPSPPAFEYYLINAHITDGKLHSGYRKRIYQDAELHGALYDIRQPGRSIWYPDGSTDLNISLMFSDKDKAHRFLGCLVNYNLSNSLMKGRVQVDKRVVPIESAAEGSYVHSDEYVFEESDSPANTCDDIKSASEMPNTGDPVRQLRSLENLSKLPIGDTVFRCHIAPDAFYKQYTKDPDNIIYGSHLFHAFFDGDGKRRREDRPLDWGTPPRFKIEYESTGPDHMFQGVRYYMMYVKLTFQDPAMARSLEGLLREGTTIGREGEDRDLCFHSYFYTTNAENCKRYLDIKQKETETRWAEPVFG